MLEHSALPTAEAGPGKTYPLAVLQRLEYVLAVGIQARTAGGLCAAEPRQDEKSAERCYCQRGIHGCSPEEEMPCYMGGVIQP
jgi:hypothetical protein